MTQVNHTNSLMGLQNVAHSIYHSLTIILHLIHFLILLLELNQVPVTAPDGCFSQSLVEDKMGRPKASNIEYDNHLRILI